MILVPTFVNESPTMLFGLDTGAFANILSLREGCQLGKVVNSDFGVEGLNGELNSVYSAKATLGFGGLQQPSMEVVTFDLSTESRRLGTEVSGFLGFAMLRLLEIKLDSVMGWWNLNTTPNVSLPSQDSHDWALLNSPRRSLSVIGSIES